MRRHHKGFTLIEFLIALVIIGFIVALLVNFFSDPLDEARLGSAATQIVGDMATIEQAVRYGRASKKYTGGEPYPTYDLTQLVADGLLTGTPRPPQDAALYMAHDGTVDSMNYLIAQAPSPWVRPATGAVGKNDTFIVVSIDSYDGGVNRSLCQQINKQLGVPAIPGDADGQADPAFSFQCFRDTTGITTDGVWDAYAVIRWLAKDQ